MARLASSRQPAGQELHWKQAPALRCRGAWLTPSASAPSRRSWPLRPIRSGSTGRTSSISSAACVVGVEVAGPFDPVL